MWYLHTKCFKFGYTNFKGEKKSNTIEIVGIRGFSRWTGDKPSDLGRSIATIRFCTACAVRGAKARSTCARKIVGYSPTCTCRAVGLFRSIPFVVTFSPFDNLDLLWMSLWTPLGSRLVTVTRLRNVFAPSSWFEFIGFIGMAMSLLPATFPCVNTYHD